MSLEQPWMDGWMDRFGRVNRIGGRLNEWVPAILC